MNDYKYYSSISLSISILKYIYSNSHLIILFIYSKKLYENIDNNECIFFILFIVSD
jgi:hypothetical protein